MAKSVTSNKSNKALRVDGKRSVRMKRLLLAAALAFAAGGQALAADLPPPAPPPPPPRAPATYVPAAPVFTCCALI